MAARRVAAAAAVAAAARATAVAAYPLDGVGAVRGMGDGSKIRPPARPPRRRRPPKALVQADLTDRLGAFDAAMSGAASVLHTASPYEFGVRDAQTQLVEPAIRGTASVSTG